MPRKIEPTGNSLLDVLSDSLRATVVEPAQTVFFELRDVVYQKNRPIRNIVFPVSGVISWVQDVEDNKSVEVATVGNEGFVGVPVLLGADRTQGTSFAQIAGEALSLRVTDFRNLLARYPRLGVILNRYVQALIIQIAQGNACNGTHSIEQRCARWLLVTHDRMSQASFSLTQEFMAQMLGVRRAGVSEVAAKLQSAGLIQYARGEITIVDRKGLLSRSCRCYEIIREEFRRMLRDIKAAD